ncbi:hypothetical protein PHYBLDRAFT_169619 [Phycomyces blakesleeanus NRRL 1555(-)]|uniref:Calcineurin-like phosphoesterase domain-containing protein n=1 Tax=Phycomyces blakesleeanus (strain ATCC 8743b / DSM 1359 / FGSC 10004 / NBRC 33097 / NRRL 1555) TaxID=763407 RepID=A0A163DN34_PHYB8|nr:hypothetical protein PHYBLDRAFT_169619 [Phycomyces blakesleeanus NRRL 1555(-)]OAD72490.1 hypothetical protein PHYBLDRAFT_169619 [Phycomyces blakesleeanus NRRL 1555(-)]|eukprot:XP_018290530.1 hypothetical protein PHYBLDRAFT_169619 [Phycomyces blakesleeanus NRRL 1555(-)]
MSQLNYEPYSSVSFHHKQPTSPYPYEDDRSKIRQSLMTPMDSRSRLFLRLSNWWHRQWARHPLLICLIGFISIIFCLSFVSTIQIYGAFVRIKLENTLFDRGWFPCGVLRKDPVLFVQDTHHIQVVWETNCGTDTKDMIISWYNKEDAHHLRQQQQQQHQVIAPLILDDYHTLYKATIGPLNTTSTFAYRIEYHTRDGSKQTRTLVSDQEFKWHVTGTKEPIRIAAMADNQFGLKSFVTLLRQISRHKAPHYLLHAGDAVQKYSSLRQWQTDFLAPLTYFGLGQRAPMIYAHGNHDHDPRFEYQYTRTSSNKDPWYAFSLANGAIRFCVLDSNLDWKQQDEWLQQELASEESQSAAFRLVVVHVPPFLEYWEPDAWFNLRQSEWGAFVKNRFVPLFEKYNVDLVISGHQHNYERGERNGISYAIIGGAGGDLDFERVVEWGMYEASILDFHYVLLEFEPPNQLHDTWSLSWNTYDLEGHNVDTMTLNSKPSPHNTTLEHPLTLQ